MTDTPHDLNLRIAEILEAKPTEQGGRYDSISCQYRIENGTNNRKYESSSPNGCWIWRDDWEQIARDDYSLRIHRENKGDWQPRAFDSDPAAILMLMERLLANAEVWASIRVAVVWDKQPLGNAVALAFLKAHEPHPQAAAGADINAHSPATRPQEDA